MSNFFVALAEVEYQITDVPQSCSYLGFWSSEAEEAYLVDQLDHLH